ncbi:uncharacterized protein [Zea mays]|uniref:Uncharacterized protein n=1 Tax=Zea mays TaxID=4577 RepID=B6U1X6_MAIZE|nr:uncharacterized protein LOC100275957 isoform 2 [Zea mays]XP_035823183.1 uncharacterized protein LOC111589234 isoform X2 [Zea mays]XP_035823184.1 uncharacterized protein LOC118476920 [Zea mays]ACG43359.1 hypothetical protein [Zea mays]|eukprot:XP_023157620.1 uncharacterized protein LOC100275957 isoform X1 [Zea mays]
MARSLRPVVDLRVTKNPEPAEDPAPSPIVWPNALAPSSSSTPPPSRPAIHRSADRRATAAMGFHRAAITRQEQVPQDEARGGCCDEFVSGLGRRLPVNFGLLDRCLLIM